VAGRKVLGGKGLDNILESFAEFAAELSFNDLPANAIKAGKERLLDSIGCAINAYNCDTAQIGLSLAGRAPREEVSGRILASTQVVAADAAAFINSCMIRNLDFNDTYPGGHPSDSLGALFAVAPQVKALGRKLLTAAVVAYEIFIRVQMAARLRERGWDQGFGISVGAAASLVNLLGLNREVARHAIAITAVGNMPMRATRAGQLSMWKGAATAYAVRNAVFGVQLAAAGMTGPEAPFVGRHGLFDLITGPIDLPPFGREEADFFIPRAKIKYWPVVYNMQALVWAAIELRNKVLPEELASVDVDGSPQRVQLFGSGAILRETIRAQKILAERFKVASDVWSVTSYTQLRRDAQECERWNMLHPSDQPRASYLEQTLAGAEGPYIAASDYLRCLAEQVSPWVAGGLFALGTDGMGRSENRATLRRHFEVDAECIAIAALYQLKKQGKCDGKCVARAVAELGVDPEKQSALYA